jgi:hypothetical protein
VDQREAVVNTAADTFLLFFHIERAGGTSVHDWLLTQMRGYYPLNTWYYWSNEPEHGISPEELARLARWTPGMGGAGGHTLKPWFDYEATLKRATLRLTFLREPRARFLSHFNHQRMKMGIPWTIEQFAAEVRFSDYQTVRLSGSRDLETAVAVLDSLDVVGFVEQLPESLRYLCAKRGWYERSVPGLNRLADVAHAFRYEDLTTSQQRLVDKANALDIQLYKRAHDLWSPRLAKNAATGPAPMCTSSARTLMEGSRVKYRGLRRRIWSATTESLVHRMSAVPYPLRSDQPTHTSG